MCAAHFVTDCILAIGFALAVDRAMFEQATIFTKDVIAAPVVVRTAAFFGEICAVLGLAGPLALTAGCVANLAGRGAGVRTQATAAIIAATLVCAFRYARFALTASFVASISAAAARGTGAVATIGTTLSVVTIRDTSALAFFPAAPVVLAGS